jgi:hypothetical protein
MRARIVAVVCLAAVALSVVAVVTATAKTRRDGLPAYVTGWERWPKINRKPFSTPGPHSGVKNVYASKQKRGATYPNGTVIVKTIIKPGTRFVGQFAVMRKVNGRWQYIEWERPSPRARYALLAKGQLCQSCHMQARANDYVFTKR